jgi:hypothetical protein
MSRIEEAIERLRRHSEPTPNPLVLPTEQQVATIEEALGIRFRPDYRTFLLKASDVVFGSIEPATITSPESHNHLPKIIESARDFGVPDELFPFCEDNNDFYCLDTSGEVVFWSHDCSSDESWSDLAEWIELEWIGENT